MNTEVDDLRHLRAVADAAERSGRDVLDTLARGGYINTPAIQAKTRADVLARIAGVLDRSTVSQLMGEVRPTSGDDLRKRLIELLELWHDQELITAGVRDG